MDPVPDGSIYLWMYRQGLKRVDLTDISLALFHAHKSAREKDIQNYWNGYYRSAYSEDNPMSILSTGFNETKSQSFMDKKLCQYPVWTHDTEYTDRWVPCNADNKPMIKWSQGCMNKVDAKATLGCKYLAENMKGSHRIVIDCDGDHDYIDYETIEFLNKYTTQTHTLSKPKLLYEYEDQSTPAHLLYKPASFHLTFETDHVIPTMHFPEAHIDIIGNEKNSLRYLKNKIWNGIQPKKFNEIILQDLQQYIKHRMDGK